ncbi:MAG: hypothetical protein EXS60_00040 [Candidatus Pacebacteria bacterium]|nr:hypothetical protein [Candidatus Paceibacterota bacterium]
MIQISLFLGILLLAGGILCGYILNDAFTQDVMKWITITTFAVMIPLSLSGSAKIGKYGKWQFETANVALTRPKKEERVDKRSPHDKNMENLMQLVVNNTSKILENQEQDSEKEEKVICSEKGHEDAKRDFENGDTSKMKPTPETEQALPQIVIPEEIPERSTPQKAEPESTPVPPMPKGNLIPPTAPKADIPNLFVQTQKQESQSFDPLAESYEPATHVLGTCGKAHAIITLPNGQRVYGPCRDQYGFPACKYVREGTMNWKK